MALFHAAWISLVGLTCVDQGLAYWISSSESANDCQRCQDWYAEEIRDLRWLRQLNREIPCPCHVTQTTITRLLTPTDPLGNEWDTDPACNPLYARRCGYHPGAWGCLRSERSTSTGAGQQCCYDRSGNLLPPSHPGAGTPDKKAGLWNGHRAADVEPYEWCCKDCPSKCDLYMTVRRGDDSHC